MKMCMINNLIRYAFGALAVSNVSNIYKLIDEP